MSEEKTVTEPEDDATVVHDEAAEEKAHDKLVSDVTKMLDKQSESSDEKSEDTAGETGEKPPKGEESKAETEPKDEKPAELNDELQARAEGAGISKELAQRLHQSGQLEEVMAMSDQRMIDYVQSKETEEEPEEKPVRRDKPPEKEPKAKDQEDAPNLDPEVYDEDLVKRDAYQTRRIDALESQIGDLIRERQSGFDEWFDGAVDGLEREDLFGKGTSVPKDKQANRDVLFKAYNAVCSVYNVEPNARDPEMTQFAFAAKFREEIQKQADKKTQQQTVDRMRDAEGKFLSSSKPKGAPPAKGATDEEVHEQLVSDVTSLLKERGVQMSGV